jgi:outer membrane protein assembly factor BamB
MKPKNAPFRGMLAALCLCFVAGGLWGEDALWRKVLSGDVAAPPVVRDDRVFVATRDRTLTCLSEDGDFLWSRPLPGKPTAFLCVASSGLVVASSESGIISAFSLDGSFLWQLRGPESPLFAPREGRDGRLFFIFRDRIVCVSGTGGVKWTLGIAAVPVASGGESGDGDLLVPCADGTMSRISPYGELRENIRVDSTPAAILPVPSGFVAGFRDGTTRCFDVRSDTETVWVYRGSSAVSSLTRSSASILILDEGGLLSSVNETDGAFLWSLSAGLAAPAPASVSADYGQITVTARLGAWAASSGGQELWRRDIPERLFNPALSENGIAYTANRDWVIEAWRVESRIKNEKKPKKEPNYGILNGKSRYLDMPWRFWDESTAEFLDSVSRSINAGSVGTAEVNDARRLAEILGDGDQYMDEERARAATLLGKLGSAEYRDKLAGEAARATGSTLSTGILLGLAASVPDPDGSMLDPVRDLVKRSGSRDEAVAFAACDALYSLVRYSSGATAREGTVLLTQFLDERSPKSVNEYARQTLGRLLK